MLSAKFTALLVLGLICAAQVASQNLVRSLAFEYRYSSFAGSPLETAPIKRNTFIFFYTPNLAAQKLDIAVACRTSGWVGSSLNPSPTGGMVTPSPPGNFGIKGSPSFKLIFSPPQLSKPLLSQAFPLELLNSAI
jgi:hypothetical protein